MKNRNKVWAFGCSFTEMFNSSPVRSTKGSYSYSDREQKYHWLNILSFLLSVKHDTVNLGVGGSSIKSTLHHLLLYLPKIQAGDKVIIGHTSRYRDTRILSKTESKVLKELHLNSHSVAWIPKVSYTKFGLDKIDLNNIVKVFLSTSEPSGILNVEYDYYTTFIKNIGDMLEEKGVEVYKWYTDIWAGVLDKQLKTDYVTYPEDISTWSRGVLRDGHWSPNGHQLIGVFFKYCIDNNIKEFTKNHYNRFIMNFNLKNLPFPYLPFKEVGSLI